VAEVLADTAGEVVALRAPERQNEFVAGRHDFRNGSFASDAFGANVTPGPKMVLKADVAGNLTN